MTSSQPQFQLNDDQSAALEAINAFMRDDSLDAFVLRGSAGTGKTTLVRHLAEALNGANLRFALLAPTGRAARILSRKVQPTATAQTIHSLIYPKANPRIHEEASASNDPGLRLDFPLATNESLIDLLVVDEASMVGDQETDNDELQFGSGRLLSDLITFARVARADRVRDHRTKLLFIGDPAQLPPVGEKESPALSDAILSRSFGLAVASFDLTQVMRQTQGSAILARATAIRNALMTGRLSDFSVRAEGQDIEIMSLSSAITLAHQSLDKRMAPVIVRSNGAALSHNRMIRARRWGSEDADIQAGDVMLVNRNHMPTGLCNGDQIMVHQVLGDRESVVVPVKGQAPVTLHFRRVAIKYRGVTDQPESSECLVLENLLDSAERTLKPVELRALWVDFGTRWKEQNPEGRVGSEEFYRALLSDDRFTALHVKYGYAMTCHKAQGGEWGTAIVDFSTVQPGAHADFFRWAYTAITRAKNRLIAISPPEFTATSGMKWGLKRTAPTFTPAAQAVCDASSDPELQRDALAPIPASPGPETLQPADGLPPFICDFVRQIDSALAVTPNLRRTSLKLMPYRLRLGFHDGKRQGEVDFSFNSKEIWTTAAEVGGPGRTRGLLDDVQKLMNPSGE